MKPRQFSNVRVPDHAMTAAIRGCAAAARRRFTGSEIKAQVLEVLAKPSALVDCADCDELATAIVTRGQKAVVDRPQEKGIPYRTWGIWT